MGKDYSAAQELMEDEMKEYYSQSPTALLMQSVNPGQLVAAHAEEDAWLRAQIIAVEDNRMKASILMFWHSTKDTKHEETTPYNNKLLLLIT